MGPPDWRIVYQYWQPARQTGGYGVFKEQTEDKCDKCQESRIERAKRLQHLVNTGVIPPNSEPGLLIHKINEPLDKETEDQSKPILLPLFLFLTKILDKIIKYAIIQMSEENKRREFVVIVNSDYSHTDSNGGSL